jgi:hypothetical protein
MHPCCELIYLFQISFSSGSRSGDKADGPRGLDIALVRCSGPGREAEAVSIALAAAAAAAAGPYPSVYELPIWCGCIPGAPGPGGSARPGMGLGAERGTLGGGFPRGVDAIIGGGGPLGCCGPAIGTPDPDMRAACVCVTSQQCSAVVSMYQ